MSYSVEYESEALADLEKLAPDIRKRIVNKIEWLAQNFEQITPQSLTGDWAGFYKLRVGNYSFFVEKPERTVFFLEIKCDCPGREKPHKVKIYVIIWI